MGADYGALESALSQQPSTQNDPPAKPAPRRALVHGALVVVFLTFGSGSFISKFGIHGASPLVFELVRETCAGPPFLVIARALGGRILPDARDGLKVLLTCSFFALSQACFFLGLKHESPAIASTWQVALPITTTAMAVLAGTEQVSLGKVVGIVLASGGATWMTLGAVADSGTATASSSRGRASRISGHALFFGQCVLNAAYMVFIKPMVRKYGSCSVTGWAFTLGSFIFLAFAGIAKMSLSLSWFICEDTSREVTAACVDSIMAVPASMVWPLLYDTVFCSFVAWHLLSWSLAHARASVVSIYTVVQPCTTCLLSLAAIGIKGRGWAESYGITAPGLYSVLGAILIGAGLSVTFSEDVAAPEPMEPRDKGIQC